MPSRVRFQADLLGGELISDRTGIGSDRAFILDALAVTVLDVAHRRDAYRASRRPAAGQPGRRLSIRLRVGPLSEC
jgi:hypothetical protein